jgi:hypothetical protein
MPALTLPQKLASQKRYDYYNGDTWRYWIGPKPPASSSTESIQALAELERVFQRSNKIRECLDRVINGLVAKPFQWELVDESGEAANNPVAAKMLTDWLAWCDEKALQIKGTINPPLWDAVKDLVVDGRGYLRLWRPDRLNESPELWQQILVSRVLPGAVTKDFDDDGFIESYSVGTSGGKTEKQTLAKNGTLTVNLDGVDTEYQIDGNWLLFEMSGESMVTADVIDAQNAINLALTMQARSLIQNGFVERVLMNAQMPGRWVPDEDPTNPTGQRFEPDPNGLRTGPGLTSFVQGNPIYNDMGQTTGYTNPSVSYNNPAPMDSFDMAIKSYIALIYHATGQGHLLASDTDLSGVSRAILRQDASLKASQYERAIVSAIESMLLSFLRLMGFEGLRVTVQLRKAIDYVSPEERQQIIAEYNTGLLSKATAIARIGTVDDVDAELELIEAEANEAMQKAKVAIAATEKENPENAPASQPPDDADPAELEDN